MAHSDIITGQYVKLRQTPASVSDRLLAQLIDSVILMFYSATALYFLLEWDDVHVSPYILFSVLLLTYLPVVFYHPLCEWLNHGRSIGKTVMKCRVVMVDGSSPSLGGYLMRWLLYPFDTFFTGGLGVLFILFTGNNQRMGDMAAGTMVIKTDARHTQYISLNEFYYVQKGYTPTFAEAANLSMRQVEVINHALYDVKTDNRERCLGLLTEKVEGFLNTKMPPNTRREDFLYTVLNDYYYYASTIEE